MGTKATRHLLLLLLLVMGCGSLDDSDLLGETIAVDLVLKNPDESARGTAKAVDGLQPDFAVSKASATLGVSSCNICCGSVCKDVSFSSGASEVTTSLSCTAGTQTITATCEDSNKTSNGVKFGFTCETTATISGNSTITCNGLFLNQATRSSGDCRYARIAEDDNTRLSAECGFDSVLTDAQKTTAKCYIEFCADNSCTSPGTVDASSDGLQASKTNPYISMEGGLLKPACHLLNTSGTKLVRGVGDWVTDGDGNTKARCRFGKTQWKQRDEDRKFRYASSCSKDGSTYALLPNPGMAQGKTSTATNSDVSSLADTNSSCTTANDCSGGHCSSGSVCAGLSPASLTAVADESGSGCGGACTGGLTEGAASDARFNGPVSGCMRPDGTKLYVIDKDNQFIRWVNFGVATTNSLYVASFCGNGSAGSTNGICPSNSINNAEACCFTDNNTMFFVSSGDDLVRKIEMGSVTATLSTFAGSGTAGFTNGTGTAASFTNPSGIACSSDGTLYVVDGGNHAIRKITSSQVVTTLAGTGSAGSVNGTGTSASFDNPVDGALDSTGTYLYVTDKNNALIRKINTATGAVTTLLSGLTVVTGIEIDQTDTVLWVTQGHAIRKIVIGEASATTPFGNVTSSGASNSSTGSFSSPGDIILDPDGNTAYVIDTSNHKVRKIQ